MLASRSGSRMLVASGRAARSSVLAGRQRQFAPLVVPTARAFSSRFGDGRERPPVNMGFVVVPQQKAYVVERLGKFNAVLDAGWYFLIPFFDKIAYVHSRKEEAIPIPNQTAITKDNVTLTIDGVLYLKVLDPEAASYGVTDLRYALMQLAQTAMRSELGKITLDKTFEERETLNFNIVAAINTAAKNWGTEVLRYEIRDITPPSTVKAAMDMQAEAERRKRAEVLESEGRREAAINTAEGARRSIVLQAQGDAEAILARAKANAEAMGLLAAAIQQKGGEKAVALRVAEQYVSAFSKLAKTNNTILLPGNAGDVAGMVATALSMFQNLSNTPALAAGGHSGSGAGGGVEMDADSGVGSSRSSTSGSGSAGASGSSSSGGGSGGGADGAQGSSGFVPSRPFPAPAAQVYHSSR